MVLDIIDGRVVHALRGEREKYSPVDQTSRVCTTSDPKEMVMELMPKEVYIADLDRLMGRGENRGHIKAVNELCPVMLDFGVSGIDDMEQAFKISTSVVLGTETSSVSLLEQVESYYDRINLSLDLKNGSVVTSEHAFMKDPLSVAEDLNSFEFSDLIVLFLSEVGTSSGLDLEFIERLVDVSDHDILIGGGVGTQDDLDALEGVGIAGALIATSIHDGAIPLEIIRK